MKDAPINLPKHWYVAETGTVHVSYVRDYADQYARAAVMADRAGQEEIWPTGVKIPTGAASMVPSPSVTMTIGGASPSPAEPKTILERAYEAVKATKPPAPPNWKEPAELKLPYPNPKCERCGGAGIVPFGNGRYEDCDCTFFATPSPAEPPAAPVQQEQCVCNEIGLAGVSECPKHPVQQEPDWIECLRRLGRRAERAEAERDALKAELAGQAWTMRDMEDQLAALRAQASPEAPDDMRAFAKAAQAIALERAAKVCENYEHISELDNPGSWCAAAIRALISEVRK